MVKLNILIISHSFPPYMNVGGLRAYSWAKYWSELGHNITVMTSKNRGEFSYTSIFKIDMPENIEIIEIDNPLYKYFGINKNPTTTNQPVKKNLYKKILERCFMFIKNNVPVVDYYFDWSIKCISYIKKHKDKFNKFDFVITTANPLSAHQIGLYLKKNMGLKWIADYRDLEEQSEIKKEIGKLRKMLIQKYKEKVISNADLNVTVSEGLKEILLSYNSEVPVKVIYNGYFEENYEETTEKSLKWQITYTGTFYKDEFVIKPLFEALQSLDSATIPIPPIHFYGIGDKEIENFIINQAGVTLKDFIFFHSSCSNKEIANVQKSSSILLLMDGLNNKGVLKTKSYEYLAAQRPIIAIINKESELAKKFLANKSGYCVSTNSDDIKKFIERVYLARQESKPFNSLSFYEPDKLIYYSRRTQAIILLDYIIKNTLRREKYEEGMYFSSSSPL